MNHIEFVVSDQSGLAGVESLWDKLRQHHLAHSAHFKNKYSTFTFQTRIQPLLEKCNKGKLRVETAWDKNLSKPVGYCISSIVFSSPSEGEIESLYIEHEYRGMKIGHRFMEHALTWMDDNNVIHRKVTVAAGNEEALPFYEKFGFFSSLITMDYKKL